MVEIAHQAVCWGHTNCVCVRGENDRDGPSNCVLGFLQFVCLLGGIMIWVPHQTVFQGSYKLCVCEGGE